MERYQNNIQDQFGNAISGVTVTVRRVSDGALATLFSDDGVTGKSNPFTNDADGELFFYAANDRYNIFFTGPITDQKDDVLLLDISFGASTIRVKTDIATATPPTTEAVTGGLEIVDADENDFLADLKYSGSNTLRIHNYMHGGNFEIVAEEAGGTGRFLFTGDPDGAAAIYHAGVKRAETNTTGRLLVLSDGNTDAEGRNLNLARQDGTVRGQFGYVLADANLYVRSLVHGAQIIVDAEDAGGVLRTMIDADPDAGVDLYFQGVKRFETTGVGTCRLLSIGNTDTEARALNFSQQNGTERASIGFGTNDIFAFRNAVHGGNVEISGEDAGGVTRTFLIGDPDGQTILRADTGLILQTTAGESAIVCTTNADAALYYNNIETFRTADEKASDVNMGAEVRHNDDVFYPVGMNVAPEEDALDTGNETLDDDNIGKMLTYNSATARSLLFNNIASVQVGSLWALKVGPSAGTLTGDGGTGVQIRWWNGSGWTTTAAAGNITIGVGSYTIWKETDTLFWIDGPTLS